jgi:hypothetical protein
MGIKYKEKHLKRRWGQARRRRLEPPSFQTIIRGVDSQIKFWVKRSGKVVPLEPSSVAKKQVASAAVIAGIEQAHLLDADHEDVLVATGLNGVGCVR